MIYILQNRFKSYIILDTTNKISSLWCSTLISAIHNFHIKKGTTDSWINLSKDYLEHNYNIILKCDNINSNTQDFKNMYPELFI